ncbi:hypothetical protein AAE478_010176 [Parahypoxylon ruwenzoriense]
MDFLISDIQEKEVSGPKAASFPQHKSSTTGFPEHKKRARVSAFKQKRQGISQKEEEKTKVFTTSSKDPLSPPSRDEQTTQPSNESFKSEEKRNIDRENTERMASMSPQEIAAAQEELFSGLDPSVLQMLLKRANLDEHAGPSPFDLPDSTPTDTEPPQQPEIRIEDTSLRASSSISNSKALDQNQSDSTTTGPKRPPRPSVADEAEEEGETTEKAEPGMKKVTWAQNDNKADTTPTPPIEEPTTASDTASKPHWPHPPQPDLDSSDPDFLSKLHEKYFPSLPADPSKLAWMAPVPTPNSPADLDSPYHPSQSSLPVSALRFDFRGMLLPPRISRAVPVTKGLHHHGEAPEAAGYTVRELARLARSAVPGQRCMAYQTLGRVLYRLGRGEFGRPGDDVADGVWAQVEEGAVLRSLYEEAESEEGRGHRSARAFAIEAIWLFEKGGWKERLRRAK